LHSFGTSASWFFLININYISEPDTYAMTYEEENETLRKKILYIDNEIMRAESLINELPAFSSDATINYYRNKAKLALFALKDRRKNIEDALKESPQKRKINNLLGVIASNLPEVPEKIYQGNGLTKSMYSISNGCLMWMIIFVVIGFIIMMIIMN
jgi:hypothetical protein